MSRRQRRNPATAITKWPGTTQDGRAVRTQVETIVSETPPATHASTHESGGSDEVELAQSQITGLTAALAAKVPTSRQVIAGAGLTGGGDLSADRTLDVGAGTGITVAANSIAADFGTGAGKVTEGNDARLSDARTPTAHHLSHEDGGSDEITIAESQVTGLVGDLATLASDISSVAGDLASHEADPDAHKGQKESIELNAGDLHLVGDELSPGPDMVYGTDASGTKGWQAAGSGGGGGGLTQAQALKYASFRG